MYYKTIANGQLAYLKLKTIMKFSLFLCCCSLSGFAQKVVVQDSQGHPIEYVNIGVKGTSKGLISDEQGGFSLEALHAKDTDSIYFGHLSYKHKVLVKKDITDKVVLEAAEIVLPEATFTAKQPKERTLKGKGLPTIVTMGILATAEEEIAEDEAEAILHTSQGDIRIKLFPKLAPLAVENFLTHAKEGYYNGVTFHRVIDGFMVQTGDPKGDGTGGESIWHDKDKTKDKGTGFKNEISPYLYNIRGSLSMANTGQPSTNGSQFFINQSTTDYSAKLPTSSYPKKIIEAYKEGGNPTLDGKHPVFGQVIDGMDVVDSIAKAEKDEKDKPTTAITIDSIEIVKDFDFSKN